jgi:hypothetical protein
MDSQDPDVRSLLIIMNARRRIHQATPYIERRAANWLRAMFHGTERRRDRRD